MGSTEGCSSALGARRDTGASEEGIGWAREWMCSPCAGVGEKAESEAWSQTLRNLSNPVIDLKRLKKMEETPSGGGGNPECGSEVQRESRERQEEKEDG